MVIRSSSASQVNALIARLEDGSPVQREAAIARLRVAGPRALDRLAGLARSSAPDVARVAALKVLESIDAPRARETVLALLNDASPAVAAAAALAARGWLARDPAVLDAVTAVALDGSRAAAVRAAALDALAELPRAVIHPVLQRVGAEDAALASRLQRQADENPLDRPAGIHQWLAARGAMVPLSRIHDTIAQIRDRERAEPVPERRQEWLAARAAAHLALAQRNSRVALYDLREAFDGAAGPLPLDLLHAAARIGDASCLEPMARAWAAAGGELWWRDRVAEAARQIVARHRLTVRHAVVKRIRASYPGFLR